MDWKAEIELKEQEKMSLNEVKSNYFCKKLV
jgi:hypothetical protein